jgi:hypothetical protein
VAAIRVGGGGTGTLLRRPGPDFARIGGMMRRFSLAVALQGTMQVLTIVIMARFVSGL